MGKPHKYAEVIKAWADGAEIEMREENSSGSWIPNDRPHWEPRIEYRVKPEPVYPESSLTHAEVWQEWQKHIDADMATGDRLMEIVSLAVKRHCQDQEKEGN